MTNEEICKHLQDMLDDKDCHGEMTGYQEKAVKFAVAALRAQIEAEQNKPLTLDELREMDGEPVWIVFTPDEDEESHAMWALVSANDEDKEIFLLNSIDGCSAYEEVWTDIKAIYHHKPMEGTI